MSEEFQYQRIFQILKNKIESGSFPKDALLPSCPKLCEEYAVSAKTIRRVFAMLSDAGLIKTSEGKRAIVIDQPTPTCPADQLREPNLVAMTDILKTAELLCYPFICRGVSLCRGEDWRLPRQIVEKMNLDQPEPVLAKLKVVLAILHRTLRKRVGPAYHRQPRLCGFKKYGRFTADTNCLPRSTAAFCERS